MKEIEVIYYGYDNKLVDTVNIEKKKTLKDSFDLKIQQVEPSMTHNNLCDLILQSNFDLLMVDMYAPEVENALRILFFELNVKNTNIIGLWNQLENPNLDKWRYELGIKTHFCYVQTQKSSIADLTLSVVKILGINNDRFEFYAKPIDTVMDILLPLRVNFFSFEEIQIETDVPIGLSETFKAEINQLGDFPFKDFFSVDVRTTNLRYPCSFQATAQYAFYDKYDLLYFSDKDEMDDLTFLELELGTSIGIGDVDEILVGEILMEFRENKTRSYEKRNVIKRLVKTRQEGASDDNVRILVIDENFEVFKNAPKMIWLYPYKFLLVSTLEDNLNILNTSGAEIVSFVIQDPIPASQFMESSEFVQLRVMCSRLKNNATANELPQPLVIIYNLSHELGSLKKILEYSNLNIIPEGFSFDSQIQIIRDFVNEKERTHGVAYKPSELSKVSPKYHSDISHGFVLKEVDVVSLSENEIVFKTKVFIEKYSSCLFRLNDELNFFATITNIKKEGKFRNYRGLVHSLDEEEKQKLRKFIFAKD